jgi:hypothetical protein
MKILQKDYSGDYTCSAEPTHWMNMIVSWLFDVTRDTPAFIASLSRSFSEALVDLRRRPIGCLLKSLELSESSAGVSPPVLSSVRVISEGRTEIPLTVAAKLDYHGGLGGVVKAETVFGQIWMMGRVNKVEGTIYVAVGERAYYVGFDDLRVDLEGRVMVGGKEWRFLNWFISKVWWPAKIRSKYLMPRMKGRWMLDKPPLPPYPWDKSVIENPKLLYDWEPKAAA